MDEATFPSLKDLAFEVLYKDLLSKATNSSIVDLIRKDFETMEITDRKWFIKKLNTTAADIIFSVLDCVMDYRFKELIIRLPVITSSDLYLSLFKLVSIVSRRSPGLEQLEVHAFHSETASPFTFEDQESCSRLTCLKKLVLRNGVPQWKFRRLGDTLLDASNRSVFSLIAKFCPALIELKIDGFCPKKEDYLGLMLGELADIVLSTRDKKWIEDLDLKNLKVAPKFLSTLCSTLQMLILKKSGNCRSYLYTPPCRSITGGPTSVFVLRNLPALILVKFRGHSSYDTHQHAGFVDAIKFLHNHHDIVEKEMHQKEFDQVCEEAASCIPGKNALITSISQSGIGILSLQSVTFAIIYDNLDSLRVIGVMCPQLKHITFDGGLMYSVDGDRFKSRLEKELEVVLNGLTQEVECIHFKNCDFSKFSFMAPILKRFAPSLKILRLKQCQEIEMTALAVCNQLEDLSILWSSQDSTLRLEAIDPSSYLTPNTFLPHLKKLNCESLCLGIWNPLLYGKSTLTDLTLECCHIKTNAEAWVNLQSLKINQWCRDREQCMLATALSAPTIFKMIPQMKSLRSISLPGSMKLKDPQATRKVTQDLANRKIPVYFNLA